MRNGFKISVVIPCYNEEEGIAVVLDELYDWIDEVIVVDNNSSDKTAEVAEARGAKVVFEARPGYGRAYKSGMSQATGDLICTLDGDGTYPVVAIPYLIDIITQDKYDFISGRRVPADWQDNFDHFLRHWGNKVFSAAVFWLYFYIMHDTQSGMWCFKREVLKEVNVTADGMPFSEELKLEVWSKRKTLSAIEIPVHFHYVKRKGESKLSLWKDGSRNFIFLYVRRFAKFFGIWRKVSPISEEIPMGREHAKPRND